MLNPKTIAPVLAALFALSMSSTALAESEAPKDDDPFAKLGYRPGFGARVGGYGFRGNDGSWTDCRMNGVGLFGTLDVGRYVFFELALDAYQSVPGSVPTDQGGMDRASWTATGGAGVRMFPEFYVVPFVEAGGGVDWSRASAAGTRASGAYAAFFLGLGAELNVFKHLKGGAQLRVLEMARPNDDAAKPGAPLPMDMAPATQGLFYLRYVL